MKFAARPALALFALLLTGCAAQPIQHRDGRSGPRDFSLSTLAKSDIDNVAEIHQQEVLATLEALTLKLYRRNPAEWRKSGHASAEAATAALFQPLTHWNLEARRNTDWRTTLREPWQEAYAGDRVRALMWGLLCMHMAAYGDRTEFYLLTEIDAQKLYNAARNTEAVAWKLANARDTRGTPILLSNGVDSDQVANLSFERAFGKLIGIQDTLARVIEDKSNRTIRFGVVNLASLIFLPI